MSIFRNALHDSALSRRLWQGVAATLIVVSLFLWRGWMSAPSNLTVHYPPDLRRGGAMKVGEIPEHDVYAFAALILQNLNYWEKDGAEEYAANLNRLQAFFTPRGRRQAKSNIEARKSRNELQNRSRGLQQVRKYESKYVSVDTESNGWIVTLIMDMQESLYGNPVAAARMEYKVRVVPYNINPSFNPWKLGIDGFVGEPRVLKVLLQ